MASYVVMEPPGVGEREPSDGALFIRDGFSIVAFLVPPLWLLWRRLWIEAALAFALGIGVAALGEAAGLGFTASVLSLLVSIYVGLEGAALRLAALRRRGWTDRAYIAARNRNEAEIRYFSAGWPEPSAPIDFQRPVVGPRVPTRPAGPALGLFGYPGTS
jgi:hypothetical protein